MLAGLLAFVIVRIEVPPVLPDKLTLAKADYADLPGWNADRPGDALTALRRSCDRFARLETDTTVGPAALGLLAQDWKEPCAAAGTVAADDPAAAKQFFERWFEPFAAGNNGKPDGLFTGYYEPELKGSHSRSDKYPVPLLGRPADLVTVDLGLFREDWRGTNIAGRLQQGALRPYPTRAEIAGGALKAQKRTDGAPLELVWVDSAIDAFFLEIQGSGRVVFEDGSLMRVGYAASNGRPYFAIGRDLIARGILTRDEANAFGIRGWLAAHPKDAPEVMNKNTSYVFFRPLPPPTSPDDGPPGAQAVPLTPGRSLAVDRSFLPLGVPIWLDAEDPMAPQTRLQRLMVAQDTGGAIRGPVRGDVFWGHGSDAAERAGRMRSSGRYWILLPRDTAERRAKTS